MENSKFTGMIVTDLRKEIAEQYKEIECLKKERDAANLQNEDMKNRLARIAELLLPPHVEKRPDIIEHAWALADGMPTLKPKPETCPKCGAELSKLLKRHMEDKGACPPEVQQTEKRNDGQQIKLQHAKDCPCGSCAMHRDWYCHRCDTMLSKPKSEAPHGRCIDGHEY